MLLERRQWIVGLVFAVLLAAGTFFGIIFQRSWITGGYNVTAEFADAAGLEAGANVLIAGVKSGAVESVTVEGDHAEAILRVTQPMPGDTRANIVLQNFLGKRAVKLTAGEAWDDQLAEGDVIPSERTSSPVDFAEFNEESAKLVNQTDVEALRTLVTSAADVTEDQREEINRLLEGLGEFSQVVAKRKDQLQAAITQSDRVFDALADKDAQIKSIIDNFGSTLDRLSERRQDIIDLLEATTDSGNVTADLIADQRQQLDRVLNELHQDLEIIDAHQVDLAHTFAYMGVSFEGYQSIFKQGNQDNPAWGNIFAISQGELGVDAIAGCGGAVDQVLDQVFGEDPRSCDEQDVQGSGGSGDDDPPNSMRGFFSLRGAGR